MDHETEARKTIDLIPVQDRDKIVLAAFFFWLKYNRRVVAGMSEEEEEQAVLKLMTIRDYGDFLLGISELTSDVDGPADSAISNIIINHPQRNFIFPNLSNSEIGDICTVLESTFEYQLCQSLNGDFPYFSDSSTDFALSASVETIILCTKKLNLPWFEKIGILQERKDVIMAILEERFGKRPELKSLLSA